MKNGQCICDNRKQLLAEDTYLFDMDPCLINASKMFSWRFRSLSYNVLSLFLS